MASADLTKIFDTIEYPDAYRITYLGNAIVMPTYDAVYRDFGLARAEYILLGCLSHFDQLTAQDVARIARRPRNTISRAVHRMVDEGHLERAPDPGDARQATLKVTPSGRALHEQISAYLVRRQEEVLSVLSKEERKTLSDILQKTAMHVAALDG